MIFRLSGEGRNPASTIAVLGLEPGILWALAAFLETCVQRRTPRLSRNHYESGHRQWLPLRRQLAINLLLVWNNADTANRNKIAH